jgi:hypothetical protein
VAATGREDWIEQELSDWLDEYARISQHTMVVSWKVAPFESDAQIGHLCELNQFDFTIGEDQDFFIFGVSPMLYKLNYTKWSYKFDECDFVDTTSWDDGILPLCDDHVCPATADIALAELLARNGKKNPCLQCGPAVGLDKPGLLRACVLAGCDYSPKGLPNVGLIQACKVALYHTNILGAISAWCAVGRGREKTLFAGFRESAMKAWRL